MTIHSIVTGGWGESIHYLVTGGFVTSNPWISRLIEQLEKTSVSTTLVDYRYCEPGLAEYTPLDALFERLEQ
jgi:hypothetical protein